MKFVYLLYHKSISDFPKAERFYLYGVYANIDLAIEAKKHLIEYNKKFGRLRQRDFVHIFREKVVGGKND